MSESAGVSSSRSESGTQPKFWATVREALRGSRQDYTEGSIGRAVLLLAVPMVLEMVLESVFAVVTSSGWRTWAPTRSPRWA